MTKRNVFFGVIVAGALMAIIIPATIKSQSTSTLMNQPPQQVQQAAQQTTGPQASPPTVEQIVGLYRYFSASVYKSACTKHKGMRGFFPPKDGTAFPTLVVCNDLKAFTAVGPLLSANK